MQIAYVFIYFSDVLIDIINIALHIFKLLVCFSFRFIKPIVCLLFHICNNPCSSWFVICPIPYNAVSSAFDRRVTIKTEINICDHGLVVVAFPVKHITYVSEFSQRIGRMVYGKRPETHSRHQPSYSVHAFLHFPGNQLVFHSQNISL